MMCHRIGRPPISTMGFGLNSVSSRRRVPKTPARITVFIIIVDYLRLRAALRHLPRPGASLCDPVLGKIDVHIRDAAGRELLGRLDGIGRNTRPSGFVAQQSLITSGDLAIVGV